MKSKLFVAFLSIVLLAGTAGCDALAPTSTDEGLTASGTISTSQIQVAPEVGGKVLEILAAEGDRVETGDALFRLDDEMVAAQVAQAQAAVDLAAAGVETASAALSSAQIQAEMVVQQARLADRQNRLTAWTQTAPEGIDLPAWYFDKGEDLDAAQTELDAAAQDLELVQADLADELDNASNEDFLAVEQRLAAAQLAYEIALATVLQAEGATGQDVVSVESGEGDQVVQSTTTQDVLIAAAQEHMDEAEAELNAAQMAYDRVLSTSAAERVLEARANVAVGRTRYDLALDALMALQTGEDSLQVQAARAGVTQAESAVAQAQAGLVQAQAALDLLEMTRDRLTVTAPADGTILSLNVEPGELLAAGSVALTIGQLDEVYLTVYVPENQYGQITVGQKVTIRVDSFPNREFSGQVQAIADEAEYTPRNVQTTEGRQNTVFAVKILVPNVDQALKPGMPADVDFNR